MKLCKESRFFLLFRTMEDDIKQMGLITIFGIAVSLSMDAFSVCIAAGVKIKDVSFRHYFRLAFHFGLFQFFMPLIGFYGGIMVEELISRFDHWIALALLSVIGIKMIWESFGGKDETRNEKDPSRGASLIMLSIATSIDAAAVGFSLAALKVPIFFPSVIIGMTCALFSVIGLFLGKKIGAIAGSWAERIGGSILIIIGIKILLEHISK